jgi:hypothetical protein
MEEAPEYVLMEDDNFQPNRSRDSVLGLRGKPAPQSLGYARLQVNFTSTPGSGETLDLKQGETVKVLQFDGDGSETVYIVTLSRDRPEQCGMIPTHLLHLVGDVPLRTEQEEPPVPPPAPPPVDYDALYAVSADSARLSEPTVAAPLAQVSPPQQPPRSGGGTRSRSESTETAVRNAKYEAAKAAAANAMAALLQPDDELGLMD